MEPSSCNPQTVYCLASKRVRAVSIGLQPLVLSLSGRNFRLRNREREQEWGSALPVRIDSAASTSGMSAPDNQIVFVLDNASTTNPTTIVNPGANTTYTVTIRRCESSTGIYKLSHTTSLRSILLPAGTQAGPGAPVGCLVQPTQRIRHSRYVYGNVPAIEWKPLSRIHAVSSDSEHRLVHRDGLLPDRVQQVQQRSAPYQQCRDWLVGRSIGHCHWSGSRRADQQSMQRECRKRRGESLRGTQ